MEKITAVQTYVMYTTSDTEEDFTKEIAYCHGQTEINTPISSV